MTKHIAVYLRVSTLSQSEQAQHPDLERWVRGQFLEVRWYRDTFTGTAISRPGFDKLQAAINEGQVASVVIWRLDRLGRTAQGLTTLFNDLQARKVNLVSIRDGLDLETPTGRLMANALASVAKFEAEAQGERSLTGLTVARANGVKIGRPRGIRTRVKVTDEQVKAVRDLRARGGPDGEVASIARATGLSRPTVYRLLEGT